MSIADTYISSKCVEENTRTDKYVDPNRAQNPASREIRMLYLFGLMEHPDRPRRKQGSFVVVQEINDHTLVTCGAEVKVPPRLLTGSLPEL